MSLTCMNCIVQADLPTPPGPTTTSLYIEDTCPLSVLDIFTNKCPNF